MAHSGRCLCGEVRYEVSGELPPLVNCHCQFCRRAHGAAFVTIAWVPAKRFRFTHGEDRLQRFVDVEWFRGFCEVCGTRILNGAVDGSGFITLIVSTLDDQSHPPPVVHVNVESKAGWYVIEDGQPQFQSFSPEVIEVLREASER